MKIVKQKNKESGLKSEAGFSLIEMLISICIFSFVMLIVTSVFVKNMDVQRRMKGSQRNIEDARLATETMAKTLRTSKVFTAASTTTSIDTFDYSQSKCIRYFWSVDSIYSRTGDGTAADGCTFSGPPTKMIDNNDKIKSLSFKVLPSTGSVLGRVTITMKICSNYNPVTKVCDDSKSDEFPIQTTVSLRN